MGLVHDFIRGEEIKRGVGLGATPKWVKDGQNQKQQNQFAGQQPGQLNYASTAQGYYYQTGSSNTGSPRAYYYLAGPPQRGYYIQVGPGEYTRGTSFDGASPEQAWNQADTKAF